MNKVPMKIMLLLGIMLLLMGCTNPGVEVDQETESIPQMTTETEETQDQTTAIETEPEETQYTGPAAGSLDYMEYLAMPVEEQEAYYNQFDSFDEFMAWYNQAEADYLASVETSEPDETRFEESVEDWE